MAKGEFESDHAKSLSIEFLNLDHALGDICSLLNCVRNPPIGSTLVKLLKIT